MADPAAVPCAGVASPIWYGPSTSRTRGVRAVHRQREQRRRKASPAARAAAPGRRSELTRSLGTSLAHENTETLAVVLLWDYSCTCCWLILKDWWLGL